MSPTALLIQGKPRVGEGLAEQDVLWCYLDAAKLLDFFHNQTLYFSRGDQFADKFEGSFTKSLRERIETSYEYNKINFTYDQFRQRMRERVFVNCWHKSTDDSMAMWSLYGRSTCSAAITTTVGNLSQVLREQQLPYYVSIERVEYVKHWRNPKLDISPYSRVFAYKTKAYEFEKETRVLIDRSIDEFDGDVPETGMPIKIPQRTLLRSIVIAPEAPPWFESLIRDVAARYDITAPVRRSKLASEPI